MNKLFVLTLVALVGCAAAASVREDVDDSFSEAAMFEPDHIEIARVASPLFKDYCIRSRDQTERFLKETVNNVAMTAFNVMFNNINEIAVDASSVQQDLVKEASDEIRQAGLGEAQTEEELKEKIAEAKENVERKGLIGTLSKAAVGVVKGVLDTVAAEAMARLARLKAAFNTGNFDRQIHSACNAISGSLKTMLSEDLQKTKQSLLEKTTDEQLRKQISEMEVYNVGCVTTGRITSVSNMCSIFQIFGPVVYPLLRRG